MFKTRVAVFYRDLKPRGAIRPNKTRAASFLNGFKNIPGNDDAFVNVGKVAYEKNIKHCILIRRRFYRI